MNYIQYEIKDGQLMTPKPIAIQDIKNLEVKILPAKKDTFEYYLEQHRNHGFLKFSEWRRTCIRRDQYNLKFKGNHYASYP